MFPGLGATAAAGTQQGPRGARLESPREVEQRPPQSLVQAGFAVFATHAPTPISPELEKPLVRSGKLEPGYFLVHFRGAITARDKDWLDGLTARVRRADGSELARWYVPDDTLVVWVDGATTWLALERSERTDWVGRYQPAYKLDPALADAPLDVAQEWNIDLVPGHAPERVIRELEASGVRVREVVHHRGRGAFDVHFLVAEGPPRLLAEVAWVEGIRLVQPRGAVDPLTEVGLPRELDSRWVGELTRRMRVDQRLTGRLAGEQELNGYNQVSALLDLLAFDHPLARVELSAAEPSALAEAPVKNALVLAAGEDVESAPGTDVYARALVGRGSSGGSSAALGKALWIDSVDDVPPDGTTEDRSRIVHDEPRAAGFFSPHDAADVHTFRCLGVGEPLRVTLVWTDEPGRAGPGKKLVNDLDLVVTAPNGTVYRGNHFGGASGASLPGGRGDSLLETERIFLENPQSGVWTVAVRPSRGNYSAGQGYALCVSGRVLEGTGSSESLLVPTTLTLRVTTGANSKSGALAAADLDRLRASDDSRYDLRDREELTLAFERTVPAGALVSALRVFVEHHEEPRMLAGDVRWRLLLGATALATSNAPLRLGPEQELLDVWPPTSLPADANGFQVSIQNNSSSDDVVLDRVFVEIDYVLSDATLHVTSTPNPAAVVGLPYDYDADDRAEANAAGVSWSVVSGPAGFSIHPTTGLVSWTPASPGSIPLSIRAQNASGAETQAFVVTVSADAPLPATLLPINPSSISYCPPERLALGAAKSQQRLNVFLPPGAPPPGGWPVVVNNRAGGGIAIGALGSLSSTGATAPLHAFLASRIAVVDFGVTGIGSGQGLFYPPGHPSGRYESFRPNDDNPEKDGEWAAQWVHMQTSFPLNTQRICLRGASHGAILSIWAAMGPERARPLGSTQARASTRVKAVLALQPPTSVWAYDQSPNLASRMIAHYEQQGLPGVPATALAQVAEALQKDSSVMSFAFQTPAARARNEAQPICLLYADPVKRVGAAPASMALDASGFPTLHDSLSQPFIHDSWAGYVLYKHLLDLSPASLQFHAANSIFAVRDTTALAAPLNYHTRTFSGNVFGAPASAIAHQWLLRTL